MKGPLASAIAYVVGGLVALFLAYMNGKRAERIHNMQEEIHKTAKEQEMKNEVERNVSDMPIDDVRGRLQNIHHD